MPRACGTGTGSFWERKHTPSSMQGAPRANKNKQAKSEERPDWSGITRSAADLQPCVWVTLCAPFISPFGFTITPALSA